MSPVNSLPGLFTNVQLKLPAIGSITRDAPNLKGADFGDSSLDSHRHHCTLLAVEHKRNFQRTEFLQIVSPILEQAAEQVLLANTGTQESKLGGFADNKTKFAVCNRRLATFFHAKRNHA